MNKLPENMLETIKTVKNDCPREYGLTDCRDRDCHPGDLKACIICWETAIEIAKE